MSQLTSSWSEKADVTNTATEQTVTGEVHQFKPEAFLSVVLNKAVKLDLKFSPRHQLYIGNKGGMEFTSKGPEEYIHNETRR